MSLTSDQSCERGVPVSLTEPDLAAWAEKITINSANDRRGLWYGALAFWIVVTCIIAARVVFLDPGRIHPATESSATHTTIAGASSALHDTKL
jgi:hypothetical protein